MLGAECWEPGERDSALNNFFDSEVTMGPFVREVLLHGRKLVRVTRTR